MDMTNKRVVTAEQAKKSAKVFNYGNMVSVLIPFPIFIFWFGASMFVYAMYRHHPNPRVGYYTQVAAYYYYGLAGLMVPVLTFAPGDFFLKYGWMLWVGSVLLLIPLSIREIMRINKEDWQDIELKD